MSAAIADFRAAASALMGRALISRWSGKTFGGDRDMYSALGYKQTLTAQDYRFAYERGGIAGTIVDAKPESTWRGEGELVENEDPNTTTAFETAWNDLNERLNLWSAFFRADVLAGIGRYAVIVLGGPGDVSSPLMTLPPVQFVYARPFAEDSATVDEQDLEKDTASPRFGYPNFYSIQAMGVGDAGIIKKVHYTRVIHIPGEGALENELYGQPRLQRPWNYLDDLMKVVGGGSEAFWVRANQGYAFNLDKDAQLKPDTKKEMQEQIDEFIHGMRRMLRLQGVDVKTLGSDVAEIAGTVSSILSLISSVTRIPQRILLGSERGELASSQDRENWADRIEDRRTQYAHPRIVKPFIKRLIELKTIPEPKEFHTRWPEMLTLSENERADIAVKISTVNKNQGEVVVTGDEIRDRVFGLPPLAQIDAQLAERQDAQRGLPKPQLVLQPGQPQQQSDTTITSQPIAASAHPQTIVVESPAVTVNAPPVTVNLEMPALGKSKKMVYDSEGRLTAITEEETKK